MKKLFSLCLASLLAFSTLAACGEDKTKGKAPKTDENHFVTVENTSEMLVVGGESDYQIVIPDEADDYDKNAATEIAKYVEKASGAKLITVKEKDVEYDSEGKFIMIGDTEAAADLKVTYTVDELTTQGFKIVTENNSVFLLAGGGYGKVFAAYEWLEHTIGWDCIAADEIVYTVSADVPFKKITAKEVPDIEYRVSGNRQTYDSSATAQLFRLIGAYADGFMTVNGRLYHNAFSYLPPATYNNKSKKNSYHPLWYSTENVKDGEQIQLCYTAHGDTEEYELMIETALEVLKDTVKKFPTINNVQFSMEDNINWCTCETCTASREYYGTGAAVVIQFCNDLHTRLHDWFEEEGIERKVNLVFFAYHATTDAPVKTNKDGSYSLIDGLKCNEGVYVFYAPVYANYTQSFESEDNVNYLKTLEKWSMVSDEIYLWLYSTNFQNYLIPYGSFDAMQENVRLAKEVNVKYFFDEGQHYASTPRPTGFTYLKEYLEAKWLWDYTQDQKELTDKFFKYYFRTAEEPMRKYYEELRINFVNMYQNLGAPKGIFHNVLDKAYWKEGTLRQWLGYIDDAYAAIEHFRTEDPALYTKLNERIKIESIGVRYLFLALYGDTNNTNDFSMMQEFKKDLDGWGWGEAGQGSAISGLWVQWGLA